MGGQGGLSPYRPCFRIPILISFVPYQKQQKRMDIEIITKHDLEAFRTQLLTDLERRFSKHLPPKQKQWLKSVEVRKMLKISPGTLQNLRINGTLRFTKIGGLIYYSYEDIEQLLEKGVNQNNPSGTPIEIPTIPLSFGEGSGVRSNKSPSSFSSQEGFRGLDEVGSRVRSNKSGSPEKSEYLFPFSSGAGGQSPEDSSGMRSIPSPSPLERAGVRPSPFPTVEATMMNQTPFSGPAPQGGGEGSGIKQNQTPFSFGEGSGMRS